MLLLSALGLVGAWFLIPQITYMSMLSLTADELWENPLPLPKFISTVETAPSNGKGTAQNICADIASPALWRLGNTANNLSAHIVHTLEITVDDQAISQEHIDVLVYLPEAIIHDPFGWRIMLGTAGGPIVTCFDVSHLPDGLHKATLKTETTLGEKYSFAWAFQVGKTSDT